jgi:hypothetical protein
MGAHRRPALPSPAALATALEVDSGGRLVWRERPRDNGRHVGRFAGSMQRGHRIVSIRDAKA